MNTERCVVDNRVFLLGLDELYREAMKQHEREELLFGARETANALSLDPADVPIEGYYVEEEELTEYFRLVRAIQDVSQEREREVADLAGYARLKQVTGSPIFGAPSPGDTLLPAGRDALADALEDTFPDWTLETVTARTYERAAGCSDFSLVALAALTRDPVVITALRESVVLYAYALAGGGMPGKIEYVWEVDEVLQQRASQFVDAFNCLMGESLPEPLNENAEAFWMASNQTRIFGRCVRIGFDDGVSPVRHYHWAINEDNRYRAVAQDFWDTEVWTTERYRSEHGFETLTLM